MKRLVAIGALLIGVSAGLAQDPTRLFTRPAVPSRETLHNLNLKMAWRTLLPVDGKRDGINSVQVLGDEILIQLRNGSLLLLNGETGQTIWQRLVGVPYRATIPPTANESSIIGINGTRLFSLERHHRQPPVGIRPAQRAVGVAGGRCGTGLRLPDRRPLADLQDDQGGGADPAAATAG